MEARSRDRAVEDSFDKDSGSNSSSKRSKMASPNDGEGGVEPSLAGSSPDSWPTSSSMRGVKRQSRYEPELPGEVLANWSKEELSEWRKTARKVRNRESAAASRRKTRDRISELEAEVEGLKTQYEEALERIRVLTSHQQAPIAGGEGQVAAMSVPHASSVVSPELAPVVRIPPESPRGGDSWSLSSDEEVEGLYRQGLVAETMHRRHQHQHFITISRPTAVCV
jgi:hypothetical protein